MNWASLSALTFHDIDAYIIHATVTVLLLIGVWKLIKHELKR
jgi:hypothetical protein